MGPLPKRKYAKARAGERRAHIKLEPPAMNVCPQCHSVKLAHRVCPTCGYYNGREEVKIKSPK
ncbi:MAG: 50S ribosomal protein L32, partial [Dehalococcoidia bacterium]|nr:50S ribosomal protein L32 [Dehalococcoidia bacterium]